RGQRGPALERVAHAIWRVGHEVVGDAGGIPPALIGVFPESEHLAPGRVAHAGEDGEFHAGSFDRRAAVDSGGRVGSPAVTGACPSWPGGPAPPGSREDAFSGPGADWREWPRRGAPR